MQIERVIFETPAIKVGVLRCPEHHPNFKDPRPTENYVLVFPRSCVSVRRSDDIQFVTDPSMVAFWNRNQEYSRKALSPDGANADWFALRHDIVLDAVRSIDPRVEDNPDRPFRIAMAHCDPHVYLLQRRLILDLLSAEPIPQLAMEEAVLDILSKNVESAYRQWGRDLEFIEPFSQSLQEEIVYRAEEYIGRHFRESRSITDIAKEAGASPFHLCRLFRRHRKVALHARCNELRLRTALELVMDTTIDLTEVSLASGFSSHSHFTWAFKRQFGITPSAIRSCS
jgi:AraC-like DNA-binding protein